jgi:RNA 2',3'-cyclic 3'-phosphodiesterase
LELSFGTSFSAFPPALQGMSALKTRRQLRVHDQLAQLALPRYPLSRSRSGAPDRLFLAIVPPAEVAERIARLTRHLKIGHELTGKPLQPEHLHVTLCHLGDGVGVPTDVVAMATERAASIAMPSFKVGFDRVGSFKNGAFVLRGDESLIGLEILQQRLSDSLDGSPRPARAFTPRMTLLRDAHRVSDHDIEPIEWQVKDIVLVHSLLGKTTHRHLARVPLA